MYKQNFRRLPVWLLSCFFSFSLCSCMAPRVVEPYPARQEPATAATAAARQPQLPSTIPPSVHGVAAGGRPAVAPAADAEDVLLSSLALVNDRITAYEDKLAAWQKISAGLANMNLDAKQQGKLTACQQRLQDILTGYNGLQRKLLQLSPAQAGELPVRALLFRVEKEDIGFLESGCQQFIKGKPPAGGWLTATMNGLVRKSEQDIKAAMAAGDYQQVITLYGQLPLNEGESPSYEMTLLYGRALMRTGRTEEAVKVLQNLLASLRQQDQSRKINTLIGLIADLQFSSEDYDDAWKSYDEIVKSYTRLGKRSDWARQQQAELNARAGNSAEVKSYAVLLRSYLGYKRDRDGFKVVQLAEQFIENYPGSPAIARVQRILQESRSQAEQWFSAILDQVNQLKQEKKFPEALARLQQLSLVNLPPDKQETLRQLTEELTTAQAHEAEVQRLLVEQNRQKDWNTGQAHLQAKEYDAAIKVFTNLLNTPYDERARAQIQEAAQLAAQERRQKAAELFVGASRARDLASRKRLLLASRQLLLEILDKYPQSGIIDKVNKNLQRIDDEIRSIDPSLLLTIPAAGPDTQNGSSPPQVQTPAPAQAQTPPVQVEIIPPAETK
ncbi:anaphase-promoting complex, cyclosome, subunit 3 [bacterium BMS3Bbin14]|nr:anaphase-promoting complex, cyclosome, subunit 3 [bacterium BMS3Bbin14]